MSLIVLSAIFLFGAMVGSFLNVCIWRLPTEEQIVSGRSHCRSCQRVIRWYDNIPLASFLWLKGRCRSCGSRISWIYPAVELATGILFLGVVLRFGQSVEGFIYALLGCALIVATVIDAREMIIPFEITKPGLVIGLLASFFSPSLHGAEDHLAGLWSGFLGAAVGAGLIYGMGWVGKKIFRKKLQSIGEEEAIGGGDFWLMAMVGAFIGWPKVLLVNFLLGPLIGSVVGIIARLRTGQALIPYGPFLSIGTLIAIFWGDPLIQWYKSLVMGG